MVSITKGNCSKLAMSPENIRLQQYYYGERVPGTGCSDNSKPFKRRRLNRRPKNDSEMDVHVKCTGCPKVFKKNSEIIPHLYEHIEQNDETGEFIFRERLQPLRQSNLRCHICMKKTSMDSTSIHVKNSHEMKNHEFSCRICELYYRNQRELVTHMHLTHPCMDMPYSCDICGYQSSFRTSVFKHFDENHQKNYVMCCFCMLIMPTETVPDMKLLEQHLMQHVISNTEKCIRCSLKFTCEMELDDHLVQKHTRHPDSTKIEEIQIYKFSKGEEPIMMRCPLRKDPRSRECTKSNKGVQTNNKTNTVTVTAPPIPDDDDYNSDDGLEIVFERLVASGSEDTCQKSFQDLSSKASTKTNINTVSSNSMNGSSNFRIRRPKIIPQEYLDALGLRRIGISTIPNIPSSSSSSQCAK